jgi:hypothetical protein
MDQDVEHEVDLHQVRRVVEVSYTAANELLDAGWILHDIYFSNEAADYRSNYILLCLHEITCPKCGAPADIEVLDDGVRVRYVCTRECSRPLPALDMTEKRKL